MGVEDDEVAALELNGGMQKLSEEIFLSPSRRPSKQLFMTAGINVILMPATPCASPLSHAYPEILFKPADLDVVVGDTAEFHVTLKNRDNDTVVTWMKSGVLLLTLGRLKVWDEGNTFYLRIRQVEENDEGMYECRIRNNAGETMCDASLAVYTSEIEDDEEEPAQEKLSFKKELKPEYIVYQGDSLNLEVQTNYSGSVKVSWYYMGNKLISTDDIQLLSKGNVHQLFIKESLLDDEGNYKCVVQSETETISTETVVLVEE